MYLNILIAGAQIVALRKSIEYFQSVIEAKSSTDEYIASPRIIYNLNLAYLLSSFTTSATTTRWTAFNILIPATKSIILVAGTRGFSIQSFEQFQKIMQRDKSVQITPVIEGIDQILIVDDKDTLRFAKVDENIKLHCQASPYGHVFSNIVDQIVEKEMGILEQIQQLSTLNSDDPSEISRKTRSVLDFFTGSSSGKIFCVSTHLPNISYIQARMNSF